MLADPLASIFWSLPLAQVSFGQVTPSEAERRSKFLKRPRGLIAAQKAVAERMVLFSTTNILIAADEYTIQVLDANNKDGFRTAALRPCGMIG